MPLARANGCALTHPLSACCQQERTLRTRQSQGPGVICRPRSRRQKRSKPLPRPLWQNEAKKPRSLKRLQPGADANRGKRAKPNHRAPPSPFVLRPISGSPCSFRASTRRRRSAGSSWISAPPSSARRRGRQADLNDQQSDSSTRCHQNCCAARSGTR